MKVTYKDHMGDDLTVVNAARVSFDKESEYEPDGTLKERDRTLLEYLSRGVPKVEAKRVVNSILGTVSEQGVSDEDCERAYRAIQRIPQHDTPTNHCSLSVHIKVPIFVSRQLVKHEYLVMSEISRRYVDSEPEFYWPEGYNWRAKADNKKQGSSETETVFWIPEGIADKCASVYRNILNAGGSPEQARMVLPLNMYTEWRWTGLLGAWIKMYNQRSREDTQWETRQIALQIGRIASSVFPETWKAFCGKGD